LNVPRPPPPLRAPPPVQKENPIKFVNGIRVYDEYIERSFSNEWMRTCDYIENSDPEFNLENRLNFKDDTQLTDVINTDYYKQFHKTMVELVPLDITNVCKFRMGHFYDGGYVILDKGLEDIEALYSIGVGGETYFEEHWLRKFNNPKFRSELYDHT